MGRRRLGIVATAGGLLLALVAQRIAPVPGPPLYDGVIVSDPYRYLAPPPGQKGDPLSASGTAQPAGGASPVIALATGEQPPQAQVFASPGALVLPAGTTSIVMSITPVAPATLPADGQIAGNVYRFVVVNQAGAPILGRAQADVTVVIRGPAGLTGAHIDLFTGGAWQALKTSDAGLPATYLTTVTAFGDFALVKPGAVGSTAPGGSAAAPTIPAASAQASATAGASGVQASAVPGSSGGGGGPGISVILTAAVAAGLLLLLGARLVGGSGGTGARRP